MISYIEHRLWDWADWAASGRVINGYPRQTLEHRLHAEGGVLIRGTGRKPEPVNEEAEEIEAAIKTLDFNMQRFVDRRYIKREPAPAKSKTTYYEALHRLHLKVLEWMQDNS